MPAPIIPGIRRVARAAAGRELLSHRLNRFLHAHLLLVLVAGALPLLTPGDALARGAPWWLLHAVLYAVSLSALLLGLSSAHAEKEEFVWLLGQPGGMGPWLAGKVIALAGLAATSGPLLALPTVLAGGGSRELALLALGAAGVTVIGTVAGLAIGFWIRDTVGGLIGTVAAWLVLLFGVDLLLLGVAGSGWVQAHPDWWVLPLMVNPLDAFRITVLFAVERAAFSGLDAGTLPAWWIRHAGCWMAAVVAGWTALGAWAAWLGARRRLETS